MSGKAWSLLAVTGKRQYAGNEGYSDDPARLYRYDSTVGNSRHVGEGDLAVIRNTSGLIGIGLIEKISRHEGDKQRFRCPTCSTTSLKHRTAMSPAYRCAEGHEFGEPAIEIIGVTHYEAAYGNTWLPLPGVMDAEALRSVTPGAGTQNSIRAMDAPAFAGRIAASNPEARALLARFLQAFPAESEGDGNDGYVPSFEDRRMVILRSIRARRGQTKFRSALIDRHGPQCMISGCKLMEIVEAAHIWPYRGEEDNSPSNGLLLRSDLHTLFDLDLVGIEPGTLKIHMRPALKSTSYGEFEGRLLLCGSQRPNQEALTLRWRAFKEAAGDVQRSGLSAADKIKKTANIEQLA